MTTCKMLRKGDKVECEWLKFRGVVQFATDSSVDVLWIASDGASLVVTSDDQRLREMRINMVVQSKEER